MTEEEKIMEDAEEATDGLVDTDEEAPEEEEEEETTEEDE